MPVPQALAPNSGANLFAPSMGDFVVESYSRIQIRPPAFTRDHFVQARMSANLLFSEWSNIGMPLLWKVEELKIPLIPGKRIYTLPTNVVAPLDAFIRTYQTGQANNFPTVSGNVPAFVSAAGSTSMIVWAPESNVAPGDLVWFPAPIGTAGQVIQGAQLVTSVLDSDHFEITLTTPSDGTTTAVLPEFSATAGSSVFEVFLPNHGLYAGQTFNINLSTTVAGILLNGGFTVVGVTGPDTFMIQGPGNANATLGDNYLLGPGNSVITGSDGYPLTSGGAPGVVMNGGLAQIQTQQYNSDPIDFIMYPLSRTEYADQPDKFLQFRPTTFWFDRQTQPKISFWNEPDNAQPYVFHLWCMLQPYDADPANGVGVDVPYRWYEAFASGLATKLARKFPPPPPTTIADLRGEAQQALTAALSEDIERVPFYLAIGSSSYWR